MNWEGKVALVTGAAGSGLGHSIASTLAREGAHVIVNYRSSQANAEWASIAGYSPNWGTVPVPER